MKNSKRIHPRHIISTKSQGVIRNPFAFYFPIQRGFSGSIQTLPFDSHTSERGSHALISRYVTYERNSTNLVFLSEICSFRGAAYNIVYQVIGLWNNTLVHPFFWLCTFQIEHVLRLFLLWQKRRLLR